MTKVYKIAFFSQKVEEKEGGVRETVTSSMQYLPEEFAKKMDAEEFVDKQETIIPADGFDRFFVVSETLKIKSKKNEQL